ncbi:MAG: DNA-3-methyladenine glycosylase [Actinomycetes bacterium]
MGAATLTPFGGRLGRSFFARPPLEVAPDLLGRVVRCESADGVVAVRLAEVEAYAGMSQDPASHAHRGRTTRNATMFEAPGLLYVYFSYGMHWCVNVVCGRRGHAAAVLLRAGEVVEGVELARSRRVAARGDRELALGPARLAQALAITGGQDGLDPWAPGLAVPLVTFHSGTAVPGEAVSRGPRVGVSGEGAATPWRFWVTDDPFVSRWRPGTAGAPR